MILWSGSTSFEWDEGNWFKSQLKHAVSPLEAEEIFANTPLVVSADIGHSQKEKRFHALGKTDAGKPLHLTFTMRGKKIRIISARPMHRKERVIYEKAKENTEV